MNLITLPPLGPHGLGQIDQKIPKFKKSYLLPHKQGKTINGNNSNNVDETLYQNSEIPEPGVKNWGPKAGPIWSYGKNVLIVRTSSFPLSLIMRDNMNAW